MRTVRVAAVAWLLFGASAAVAQAPAAADAAMTCEQIGAEMTALTGASVDVVMNAAERANRKRNMPTSVANTVTNGALGMAVGSVPGGVGALGIALSIKQQAQNEVENREAAKDQRAFDQMGSPQQLQNLERLAMLNELAQSKCPEFFN